MSEQINDIDPEALFSPPSWLSEDFSRLVQASRAGNLPHALLLKGPVGLGKLRFARNLAAYVLCEQRAERQVACGKCKHCRLLMAESHANLRMVQPEEAGKAIKVDQVRDMATFVAGSAMLEGSKVVIISPAESMNINAANALLKTLEEPSGQTLLILVSHSGRALLPTIRSRCQVLELASPAESDVTSWLSAQAAAQDLDELSVQRIVSMAPGSPYKALAFMEGDVLKTMDEMILALSAVLKRQLTLCDVAEVWAKDEPVMRMTWLCDWLSQLSRYAMTRDEMHLKHAETKKMFVYLAEKHQPVVFLNLYRECFELLQKLQASNNLNPQLLFEQALGQWLDLMTKRGAA